MSALVTALGETNQLPITHHPLPAAGVEVVTRRKGYASAGHFLNLTPPNSLKRPRPSPAPLRTRGSKAPSPPPGWVGQGTTSPAAYPRLRWQHTLRSVVGDARCLGAPQGGKAKWIRPSQVLDATDKDKVSRPIRWTGPVRLSMQQAREGDLSPLDLLVLCFFR